MLDPLREQGFDAFAHGAALSWSVRATIALASSMRHASSLRPMRAATSLKLSSSSLRRTMTSRWSGSSALEGAAEALGLLVHHRRGERRPHVSCELDTAGVNRYASRHVTAPPMLVVDLVADLVLGDSDQPAHQRGAVAALELRQPLERLHHRRLQDVARFDPGAQIPAHPHADEGQQPRAVAGIELTEGFAGPPAGLPKQDRALLPGHAAPPYHRRRGRRSARGGYGTGDPVAPGSGSAALTVALCDRVPGAVLAFGWERRCRP